MATRRENKPDSVIGKKARSAKSKQSPDLFYRKAVKRPDVRKIMEQLAKL